MIQLTNLSAEEKQLVLHLSDLTELCEKHCKPYYSDFLNERQTELARCVMQKNGVVTYKLWGGFEAASRVMLCVYPEFDEPETSDFPLECVNVKFRKVDRLSHRDFLGSLMALGIKRETIGDIIVQEGIASFFVKAELTQYVTSQLSKIGRVGIDFCSQSADFTEAVQSFNDRECVVSSLRLDSIVGAASRLSRSKAQQLVKSGMTAINFEVIYDTDCKVCSGDTISIRGYGKFNVQFDGTVSKKGKYRVLLRQYR